VLSHAQVTLLIAVLFIGALALMAAVLSGFGSTDRSRQAPPHLPGHDYLKKPDDEA
jgi:hypothetical protein